MSIERRITFIIDKEGFAAWKLNRLKVLASFFRSVIMLHNITRGGTANTEHILKVMSIGSQKDDLCQLWIEGSDAELACMVLTDFIADQFAIVNTSHKRGEDHCYSMLEKHRTFHLPFLFNYHFEMVHVETGIDKYALIAKLSSTLNTKMAQAVFQALLKREEISSTGIGNGIAIPHIMMADIQAPSMAILRLDKAINWHSNLGEICLIIAMLIPAPPTMEVVKAFTQITRALLEPTNCHLLTSSKEPEAIKAILFHIMARDMTALKQEL